MSLPKWLKRPARRALEILAPRMLDRWGSIQSRRGIPARYGALQQAVAAHLFGGRPIGVQSGPFRGMSYLNAFIWGSITSKWLGSYECELQGIVEQIVATPYARLIDVGCAEGYYAVGLAFRMPALQVVAYDTDFVSRRQTRALARLNRVGSRVAVRSLCEASDFRPHVAGRTVVICDIEGFERSLLDPAASPGLLGMDILVEVHEEAWSPTTRNLLVSRFSQTHAVCEVAAAGREAWIAAEGAAVWPPGEEALLREAVGEDRTNGFRWLWLTRSPHPAGG